MPTVIQVVPVQPGIRIESAEIDLASLRETWLADGKPALPQIVHGKPYWAAHWGLTLAQSRELLNQCRENPNWSDNNNLYIMVNDFVKPMTQGKGMGYALMKNQDAPLGVNVMVSHCWGENAKEFIESLERSASKDDVMFICAFSIYQNEDSIGPTIEEQLGTDPPDSPFERVLQRIQHQGVQTGLFWKLRQSMLIAPKSLALVALFIFTVIYVASGCMPFIGSCAKAKVVDSDASVIDSWLWVEQSAGNSFLVLVGLTLLIVAVLLVFMSSKIYPGRMIVVPNRECDLYTRLWCVYEIFAAKHLGVHVELANSLAACGGTCKSQEANCSNKDDARRLRQEIEEGLGYDAVNQAIAVVSRRNKMYAAQKMVFYILPYILILTIATWTQKSESVNAFVAGLFGFVIAFCLDVAFVRHVAISGLRKNGALARKTLFLTAGVLFGTAIAFGIIGIVLWTVAGSDTTAVGISIRWFFWCLGCGLAIFAFWLALMVIIAQFMPDSSKEGARRPVVAALLLLPTAWRLLTSGLDSLDQLGPSAIHYLCLHWALLAGPVNLGWSASLTWGVHIVQ